MEKPLQAFIIGDTDDAAPHVAQVLRQQGFTVTYKDATTLDTIALPQPQNAWEILVLSETDMDPPLQDVEQLRRANHALTTLAHIAHKLSTHPDPPTVGQRLVEQLRDLLNADEARIDLSEPDRITVHTWTGPNNKKYAAPLQDSLVADVMQSGQGIIITPRSVSPQARAIVDARPEPYALMCVPLTIEDRVVGALSLTRNKHNGGFSPRELAIIAPLGPHIVTIIDNARLSNAQKKRIAELTAALKRQETLNSEQNQLIQDISHELRTPLTIARGYAELLNNGLLGNLRPDQQEPAAIIVRRLQMASSLVNDINIIFNIETRPLTFTRVNIGELARETIKDFAIIADKAGITLVDAITTESLFVSGDQIQLRRVLDNLLSNALKFTPNDGKVTLRLARQNQHMVLDVTDTGIGIPEDKLSYIFERFYQVESSTNRQYGGIGLGLSLVKQIIEDHAGTINVTSQLGKGSTFTVTLPLNVESSAAS